MVVWRPLPLVGKLDHTMFEALRCTGSLQQSLCKAHPFTCGHAHVLVWLVVQPSCGFVF